MFRKVLAASLFAIMLLGTPAGEARNPQSANSSLPAAATLPTVSGSTTVGSTLTGDTGTWSPKGVKYAYQWLRCGSACQPVAGATGPTYTLGSADAAASIRYQVTASNQVGSTVAVSAPTATVSQPAQPPADTQAPTAPSNLAVTSTSASDLGLGWNASTDNAGVTGYDVYDNGTLVTTTTSLSATVPGLTCGTSYTLAVDAYDASGNHSSKSSVTATTSACSAAPSGSGSIYWGAYIDGQQTYNYLYGGTWSNAPWCDPGTQCPLPKFESNAGKQVSIEHWGQCWTCTFDAGIANVVVGRGDLPAVDWASDSSITDAQIAAGNADAYITAQAQAMKAFGHPMFLLFDEEMNGTWYSYSPGVNGNTAASFVAAWRHIHDIFTQVGATNVTWVWCPNVDSGTLTPMSQLYPGDSYVDWTGLNGYNWGGTQWQSFSSVFSGSYNTLLQVAPSKPIMLGEFASEENGGSKAAWIADALGTQIPQNFPKIRAVLWFNWRIYEKGQYWNWEIESSSSSQQAFANAIASPYYAPGGSFGNLPVLSKILPLS